SVTHSDGLQTVELSRQLSENKDSSILSTRFRLSMRGGGRKKTQKVDFLFLRLSALIVQTYRSLDVFSRTGRDDTPAIKDHPAPENRLRGPALDRKALKGSVVLS